MFGNNNELQKKIEQLENAAELRIKEYASMEKILRAELQVEIDQAVNKQKEKTAEVEKQNAVLKKEVDILNKAFENMGFDVKDMKKILDKLADAVVAKNEIKLIQAK